MNYTLDKLLNSLDNDNMQMVFRQFCDQNPLGMLLLNENYEVLYVNTKIKDIFLNQLDFDQDYVGNMFKCEYVYNTQNECGTSRCCENCKLRNSLLTADQNNCSLQNVKFSRTFYMDDTKVKKWFDFTVSPININEKKLFCLSFNDLTELMKYSRGTEVTEETNEETNDENQLIVKDRFHNNVIDLISKKEYSDNHVYIIRVKLHKLDETQNRLEHLWKPEYRSSFYLFLKDIIDSQDIMCRYTEEDFLLFLPQKGELELQILIKSLEGFELDCLTNHNDYDYSVAKVLLEEKRISDLIETNDLHIAYFKLLNKILSNDSSKYDIRL